MEAVLRIWNGKPFLWTLLAVPGFLYLYRFWTGTIPMDLVPPPGEMSARLIIFALMLTPLSMLFRGQRWIAWLIRRRRAFGVTGFAYALLHLLFYALDMETLDNILAEIGAPGIWTGWGALLLFLPLALTSNDASMRALKKGWKRLQRLAYPAAVLMILHWVLIHDGMAEALLHAAPLAALEFYRLIHLARDRSWRGHRSQPI
ncbi:MAG TPA: ferric reductase-like transmembrane domain-containing protein [Allosphingosinicella sp.]|uniref:ferric reductase-like transmembrane domain-containing protein n=1 Tax=Allosphingosinicella sp. TaxID=2823234 RepID=UPI002EDA2ADB